MKWSKGNTQSFMVKVQTCTATIAVVGVLSDPWNMSTSRSILFFDLYSDGVPALRNVDTYLDL